MARCNNDALLRKITKKPIDQNLTEVDFMLYGQLPDCRRINTRFYVSTTDTDASYDRFKKPANRFECVQNSCVNTGALSLAATKSAVYHVADDATDFASGVITFYVAAAAATTVTVLISDDSTFTNADQYTYSVPATMLDDGFYPVVIDLSQTPTDVGSGWTPSTSGAYIQITVSAAAAISSIGVFDSIEDFALNDVVKVGCLTNIGGTYDIAAIERACAEAEYDTNSTNTFTQTITGRKVTPNYYKLNPMNAKGSATEGFESVTKQFTVTAVTVNSKPYGAVILPDLYEDECGGVAVQLMDECAVIDTVLTHLSFPVLVDLDEDQFVVIKNANGGATLYFNSALVGQEVNIAYPKKVNIEEIVGSMDNLNTVMTRMSYPVIVEDGPSHCIKEVHVFDKVLITSFPATITESDTEFSFTVTICRGADGAFYHIYRVLD